MKTCYPRPCQLLPFFIFTVKLNWNHVISGLGLLTLPSALLHGLRPLMTGSRAHLTIYHTNDTMGKAQQWILMLDIQRLPPVNLSFLWSTVCPFPQLGVDVFRNFNWTKVLRSTVWFISNQSLNEVFNCNMNHWWLFFSSCNYLHSPAIDMLIAWLDCVRLNILPILEFLHKLK